MGGFRTLCSTVTLCRRVSSHPLGRFCSLWPIMRSCCGTCVASEGDKLIINISLSPGFIFGSLCNFTFFFPQINILVVFTEKFCSSFYNVFNG